MSDWQNLNNDCTKSNSNSHRLLVSLWIGTTTFKSSCEISHKYLINCEISHKVDIIISNLAVLLVGIGENFTCVEEDGCKVIAGF